jgi:hypothetical protein
MFQLHAPPLKHEHDCKTIPEGIDHIKYQRKNDKKSTIGYFLGLDLVVVV